jgi:polyphosphate kinase
MKRNLETRVEASEKITGNHHTKQVKISWMTLYTTTIRQCYNEVILAKRTSEKETETGKEERRDKKEREREMERTNERNSYKMQLYKNQSLCTDIIPN